MRADRGEEPRPGRRRLLPGRLRRHRCVDHCRGIGPRLSQYSGGRYGVRDGEKPDVAVPKKICRSKNPPVTIHGGGRFQFDIEPHMPWLKDKLQA